MQRMGQTDFEFFVVHWHSLPTYGNTTVLPPIRRTFAPHYTEMREKI